MIALNRIIDSFTGYDTRRLDALSSKRMELEEAAKPRYARVIDELHKLETLMKDQQCTRSSKRF